MHASFCTVRQKEHSSYMKLITTRSIFLVITILGLFQVIPHNLVMSLPWQTTARVRMPQFSMHWLWALSKEMRLHNSKSSSSGASSSVTAARRAWSAACFFRTLPAPIIIRVAWREMLERHNYLHLFSCHFTRISDTSAMWFGTFWPLMHYVLLWLWMTLYDYFRGYLGIMCVRVTCIR